MIALVASTIGGCGGPAHVYRWRIVRPCAAPSSGPACAPLELGRGDAPIAVPGEAPQRVGPSDLGDHPVTPDSAAVISSDGPAVEPTGTIGAVLSAPAFGQSAQWTIFTDASGVSSLVHHHTDGSLALSVVSGCAIAGDASCTTDDVAWARDLSYHWLPDLESTARALAVAAYDPELGRVGAGARFSPLMRRLASGGFAIGLSLAYVDFGLRQRFAVLGAFEYDLSYLIRSEVGGRHRTWNLVLGAEAGLAIVAVPSDFGHALLLGLALDPYAEVRFYLAPNVIVPVRFEIDVAITRETSWFPALATGLGVVW